MKISFSKLVLAIAATCVLSACSTNQAPKKSTAKAHTDEQTTNTAKERYMERKGAIFNGVTIASTNNVCVDHFNFLREEKDRQYQKYSQDYNKISQGYTFLNVNKNIMDKDAKEIYTMSLNMKLDTLCSKLQYSGFQLVKEKMKNLPNI